MIEETILEIKRRGIKKVAVFGTLGTLNSKVYNKYAKENGIEVKELSLEDKKTVMDIIYKIKETNKRADRCGAADGTPGRSEIGRAHV